jgi:2-dehydro-3-deoxygalactonokinase
VTGQAEWIAVDWGTSNLRAWGIGRAGDAVFARASTRGMSKLTPDAYAGALTQLLADDVPAHGPTMQVLICGMAGARQGWLEAPYLDAPADLDGLAGRAVAPDMPDTRFSARILPGICQRAAGREDVMRGEETQLLGLTSLLPGFGGLVCMPGTHSKWVDIREKRVERFATAMTGELFEVLRTHSVLRHSLGGAASGPERENGFTQGLLAAIEAPERLPALLFKVRAGSLLSGRTPDWSAGFLSGVLIGAEIGGQRESIGAGETPIVGDPRLASSYAQGLAAVGARSRIIDSTEATLAGLKAARSRMTGAGRIQ